MKILIADDDPILQHISALVLRSEGFEVVQALDGTSAIRRYLEDRPDIVLTDYEMPGLNGLEVIRRIKGLDPSAFIPIVMFTASTEPDLLLESTRAGATEFLTKPFQPQELSCRVKAIAGLARAHQSLAQRKAESDEELALVKHVLVSLTEPGLRGMPEGLWMRTLPTLRINGDACAYRMGLPDVHFGLICDATGHGLVAGVSTIFVVEAFQAMVSKDVPLEVIYAEINKKLKRILPTGRFACLAVFRVDAANGVLTVLNAGMPDIFLHRAASGSLRTFPSRNLPAGVLKEALAPEVEETGIEIGDRILAYSDGLLELCAADEIPRLLLSDLAALDHEAHQDAIHGRLLELIRDLEQHDDLSWALWECPEPLRALAPHMAAVESPGPLHPGLTATFRIDPRHHSVRDLMPMLQSLLGDLGMPQFGLRTLVLLVSEALANAIEHGLLGLDSALKEEGFEAYETERKQRLEALASGHVELLLRLHHGAEGTLRRVETRVADSGPGFPWRRWMEGERVDARASGRGLMLLRALAQDLSFNEPGNEVTFWLDCH